MEKYNSKTFFTTKDLFSEMVKRVRGAGKWPDILDYASPDPNVENLWDYRFDPLFVLAPGSNEGYYLHLAVNGIWGKDETVSKTNLGTIKTLRTDSEAVRTMGLLYADLLLAYEEIVLEHLDDLTRKGFDLILYETKTCKASYGYSGFVSEEKCREQWLLIREKYHLHHAEIRDNLSREITLLS